jgi:hypothetical protein
MTLAFQGKKGMEKDALFSVGFQTEKGMKENKNAVVFVHTAVNGFCTSFLEREPRNQNLLLSSHMRLPKELERSSCGEERAARRNLLRLFLGLLLSSCAPVAR